jgi:hypothetical protein
LLFSGSSQKPGAWIWSSSSASFSARSRSSKIPPKGVELGSELVEALAAVG